MTEHVIANGKWETENGKVLAEWCGAITAGNGK